MSAPNKNRGRARSMKRHRSRSRAGKRVELAKKRARRCLHRATERQGGMISCADCFTIIHDAEDDL